MRTNTKPKTIRTHEGAKAKHINPEQALRRSVMSCLLWENEFYEDGQEIAARIAELIPLVGPFKCAQIAVEARTQMKLRHIPLFIVNEMVKHPQHRLFVRATLGKIIERVDELTEFLAMYWKNGRQNIAKQVRRGLADAFNKFNGYQFAKYNRDNKIKLRDVLFLVHPKPKDEAQQKLFDDIAKDTLETPDTWEVQLSAGKDKKETFTRMIRENKLGALAMLRNLRNMEQVGVDSDLIRHGLAQMKIDRVLPFRFITAARYAVQYEPELETAMFKCLEGAEKLPGRTILMVDVSGSMDHKLSDKSEMTRLDAACGLAILLREVSTCRVVTFSNKLVEVAPRRGFALRDAIVGSQPHSGTYLGQCVEQINQQKHDRLIVISDEQAAGHVSDPRVDKAYMLNVASARNGVGYGKWRHIDGWSEAVVNYIVQAEQNNE